MDRAIRRRLAPRRAAVAALTGVALVVTMTGAGAITGGSSLVAVSKPTLGVGQSAAPAGNLTLTPTIPANSWAAGEIVTITVGTPIASPANCTGATPAANFVAFNGTPTVSVVGTATATLSTTSTAPCGALVTPRRDQLVITFATAGTGTLTISNVRYDIGTAVANGDVVLSATDSDTNLVATGPAASNAFLTNVGFGANTPAVGLRADSTVQPISNIVLTEQVVDAAGATVCVRLNGGDTFDATAPAPTVTVSPAAGDTAVVALAPGNTALQVTVTDAVADTAMSTFTIAGLRVSAATTASPGPVTAILTSGLCSAPATPANTISADTVVAGVAGVQRFGGSDRFTTAQQLFADAFPCGGTTGLANAVVARGDDFPDALAASYLAGTLPGAAPALTPGTGILLVDKDSATIPAATVNALRIGGVDTVYIIGGEGAVPAALATALDNLPNYNCAGAVETVPILGTPKTLDIVRIGGNDRYETGRNVAERPGLGAAGTVDYDGTAADPDGPACSAKKTAILATGENFPDALVAGPVSFQGLVPVGAPGGTVVPPGLAGCGNNGGFPLILTTGTALHPQAASALTNLGIQQVIIMGGTAAVTTATETAVQAIGGITTRRFAGLNRLDTAKQFDDFAIGFLGYSRTVVSVARGDTFPDALTGGPHAGTPGPTPNVIALTESPTTVGTETTAFFKSRPGTVGVFGATAPLSPITDVDVYGGTAAVADSTVSAILATISQA